MFGALAREEWIVICCPVESILHGTTIMVMWIIVSQLVNSTVHTQYGYKEVRIPSIT